MYQNIYPIKVRFFLMVIAVYICMLSLQWRCESNTWHEKMTTAENITMHMKKHMWNCIHENNFTHALCAKYVTIVHMQLYLFIPNQGSFGCTTCMAIKQYTHVQMWFLYTALFNILGHFLHRYLIIKIPFFLQIPYRRYIILPPWSIHKGIREHQ